MARTEKRRTNDFFAGYDLEGTPLLAPDRKAGRAGLQAAIDERGDPVLIKYWPRRSAGEDADLREIWAHEIRQLHRLAGYPGANEVIAPLVRSGTDAKGYYLALEPGPRRPLQTLLDRAPPGHWLKQTRVARHRARLWRNLKRVAQGLELLHAQGLLHRNLDTWSVLTGSHEDLDFQLTGFEWSMRIVSAGANEAKRGARSATYDSFSRDWSLFGGLAAHLCGVEVRRLIDRSIAPSDVAAHLNPEEIRFLRSLADIDPFTRIDGETIAEAIDGILKTLAAEIAGQDPKLHLVVRLGERSRLSDRIREVSGGAIENRDIARQLKKIRDDLSEGPRLVAIRNPEDPADFRIALRGRDIIYRLRPYSPPHSREDPRWDFADCNGVDAKDPTSGQLLGFQRLAPDAIEILTPAEGAERFGRLRGKLTSWGGLRQSFVAEAGETPPEESFRRGLVLTQFLEMLQAACDVFPVEVESGELESREDFRLAVKLRPDPTRDTLTKIFGWRSQRHRFEDRLFGHSAVSQGGWQLSDSPSVGDKSPGATEWQFDGVLEEGPVYLFRGTVGPGLQDGFLSPGGAVGRDAVFRRRLKALRALREHTELLGMLTDPRARILDSQDPLVEDEAFNALDQPKQDAFREIVSTLPLYLVQGPPGVGKTRLVRDLVRRRFQDDPTTRLLLTAQSNAAVNHLMDEVTPALPAAGAEAPLVIRCTSRETKDAPHEFEIAPQATRLLRDLAASPLVAAAPPRLRHRLETLAGTAAHTPSRQAGWSKETDRRSFESIVMRAANIVFATTNSAELEKLVDERGQCDWSIVEEAAKATGGELVSPCLLSHRRLMIGDHQQLPPFGALQMGRLLQDPKTVRHAIQIGRSLVGRALRGPDTDEDLDEIDDDDFDFAALCGEASRSFLLFQTLIEAEFQQQRRDRPGKPIARPLSEQHRMHPQIADLVATGFYDRLETHRSARLRFEAGRPPFAYQGAVEVPATPILVVDMPYLQEGGGAAAGDRLPPFHNPQERDALRGLLSQLRPTEGERPSLAILSPYRHQVARLAREIDGARNGRLAHLDGFRSPQKNGGFTGTVDSFQGNEADVVLVSLVRNNQHTNLLTALGFLTDKRRMNVLLSRAKWQLVLFTSLPFLDAVLAAPRREKEATVDVDHLHRVRDFLGAGIEAGSIGRIDGHLLARIA